VASSFGTRPATYYGTILLAYWSWALWPILALIAVRAKTYRHWIVAALLILVSHSLIGHKEYRFVFAAFAMLAIAGGLASVDLALAATRQKRRRLVGIVLLALWGTTSLALALSPAYRPHWTRATPVLRLAWRAFAQTDLCGLAFYDWDIFYSGGYAYLHRNVPMFEMPRGRGAMAKYSNAFNYVIIKEKYRGEIPSTFVPLSCEPDPRHDQTDESYCLARRTGSCRHRDVPFDVNNLAHWNLATRNFPHP